MRTLKIFYLSLFLCVSSLLSADISLIISPISEKDYVVELSKISKLVYSNDSLLLYDATKTLIYSEKLSTIKYLSYSEEKTPIIETNIEDQNLHSQIKIYPNPTTDIIIIDNIENGIVRLYTANGNLLQNIKTTENKIELNISNYPIGTYILFCNNKAFSIIKK